MSIALEFVTSEKLVYLVFVPIESYNSWFLLLRVSFGSSVAGGGRYDEMIGKFLGESVPAVGFSIGFERICAILLDEGFTPPLNDKIVLVYNDDDNFADVNKKAKELQRNGKIVMMLKRSKKFGKQLDGLIETGYSKMINYSDGAVKELSK